MHCKTGTYLTKKINFAVTVMAKCKQEMNYEALVALPRALVDMGSSNKLTV